HQRRADASRLVEFGEFPAATHFPRELDGVDDLGVAGATAQVRAEPAVDLVARHGGILVQHPFGPHGSPPVVTNARASRSRSADGRPSSVVTVLPATDLALTTQDSTTLPSTITAQQPHCPMGWQPFLGETMSNLSRRRLSNISSSSISDDTGLPLSVNSTSRAVATATCVLPCTVA